MGKNLSTFTSGLVKNNPTFVLVLGMCPTLATTSSAANGMGMGAATMFVLILSNIVISLIKNLIPDKVRIPAYIVVIASFPMYENDLFIIRPPVQIFDIPY